ncbi:MAG TPA: di-heme oxidoredictase family protein [Thermodesulfobacteriota bacterium]|nr:di-heme oxidoredictase family protein [Thermodesulfobacteriota bacterium]
MFNISYTVGQGENRIRVTARPADDGIRKHEEGDGAFEAIFVTSPSPVNPGLGPVCKNNSCQSCHANNGRGKPVYTLTSLQFRVSTQGESEASGPSPAAGFEPPLRTRATMRAAKRDGGQHADMFS